MTVKDDMEQRIKEYRAEKTVTGRALAVIIEQEMVKMTEDQLYKECPSE